MLAEIVTARPITLVVRDVTVTIPPLTAAEWLTAITGNAITGIVPGLLVPSDRADLVKALALRQVESGDLQDAARAAIGEASGRPWWEATRIVGAADTRSGEFAGRLLLAGINPQRVTLAGWCAAAYALAVQHMDATSRTKFDMELAVPPADADAGDWDVVQW